MSESLLRWLDEIESQADSTVPYYVPTLIAECRRLNDRVRVLGAALTEVAHHADDESGFMVVVRKALGE